MLFSEQLQFLYLVYSSYHNKKRNELPFMWLTFLLVILHLCKVAEKKWIEGGECLPSIDNLFALSRILDVPMQEILVETIRVPCIFFTHIGFLH